jgi:hypothetical protein
MRKLQDVKGEEALDVLADVLEYAVKLVQNDTIREILNKKGFRDVEAIKVLIKEGKHEIIQIMAAIDGKPYNEFLNSLDLLTLPVMLYETFNDEALQAVFTSQVQTMGVNSSGLAMENTEESEQK